MSKQNRRCSAFTLIELMVVVGIIAVLISVLIPVIASVRGKAYDANTKNWVQQLTGAIERYQSDFRAYPGPIPDSLIFNNAVDGSDFGGPGGGFAVGVPSTVQGFDTTPGNLYTNITGSENLVLGLLGGLRATGTVGALQLVYDPSIVGLGPMSLNPASPKRGTAYLDATDLSWRQGTNGKTGAFADGTGPANDTLIPEFVDKYPGAEMPILYLRARRGVPTNATPTITSNSVMTNQPNPTPAAPRGTYDLSQIVGYTATSIGEGKKIKANEYQNSANPFPSHGLRTVRTDSATTNPPPATKTFVYPFDGYAYFESPQMPNTARNKDSFILISAGADRTYGTRDDIVSFGTVGE
ncbi:MAG: type II secretion system protein [Burkholderiales bacterium]|nr:type II secretion system protein [Phycisphaerae bacterium]